jgi:hypothetical protein
MIQTLAANRADQALDVGILPGLLWRRENLPDTRPVRRFTELLSVVPVTIAQQIARRAVPREGFQQLSSSPFSRWMFGDRKVDGAAAVVRQNHENKQDLEESGRNHKKSEATMSFAWFLRNVCHV